MTDAHVRRPRLSKRSLRVWAWIAGGTAFFSPWVVLGLSPRPAEQATPAASARQRIIVRRITRRVIVQDTAKAPPPVQYVTSSSGGGSYSAPVTSSSGSVAH